MSSKSLRFEKLKYSVLPGNHFYDTQKRPLYDRTYSLWKEFWKTIYTNVGSPESFLADDFFRQTYVGVITHDSDIVAVLGSTIFDINSPSTLDHRYFKFYPVPFISALKKSELTRILSVEFLTVPERWRKSVTGLSLSEAIIGLNLKLMNESFADGVIGTARRDNKVHTSCFKFGFETVVGNVKKRNFEVELIALKREKLRPHPEKNLAKLIEKLWENREHHAPYSYELPKKLKIA